MARQLFIGSEDNQEVASFIEQSLFESTESFREKLSTFLIDKIKEKISPFLTEVLKKELYFLGSFSRGLGGYGSDLDLVVFSQDNKLVEQFNKELRNIFRNYSLKSVGSIDDLVKVSDAKGVLSAWFLKPVFKGAVERLSVFREKSKIREAEVLEFLRKEHVNRVARYGKVPGRIHFNIKNSPGGLVDLRQLTYLSSIHNEEANLFKANEDFLYKIRVLNSYFAHSDVLQVTQVKNYTRFFNYDKDSDFYKVFFRNVNKVFKSLQKIKGEEDFCSVDKIFKTYGLTVSKEEVESAEALLSKVEGLVLAPSYHVWTADQHTLKCIEEVGLMIEEFKEDFKLSNYESETLLWAAFFHDIKKGHMESHSLLGAQAVQKFGAKHSWPSDKIELISWLVREHLTLVKYSLKSDPFQPEFIKNLSLRRCTGRRAELLFLLSCADLKATNPASWSDWKKRILKQALGQILGEEDKLKTELVSALTQNEEGRDLAKKLSLKEICLVPYELLKKDLLDFFAEGFAFYEFDQKIWIRCYRAEDEPQYAKKFMDSLFSSGAYIHHALFKTLDKGIYNWVCVEAGVSRSAFEKRFRTAFTNYEKSKNQSPLSYEYKFNKISATFLKKSYAVLSFKGEDKRGALLEAIRILDEEGLNIEWGHAVTWGDQIEDVFGVSFEHEPDWSFLI